MYEELHDKKDPKAIEEDEDKNVEKINGGFAKFCLTFTALSLKRARYFKRDVRSLVCEVLLPCIIVVVGLAISLITFN